MKSRVLKTVDSSVATSETITSDEDHFLGSGGTRPVDLRNFIDYSGSAVEVSSLTIPIQQYRRAESITIETVVHNSSGEKDQEYFHRIRKQSFATIGLLIDRLERKDDISPWIAQLRSEILFGLERLGQSAIGERFEGNSIEILRILRDSIANQAWEKYKSVHVQKKVRNFLSSVVSVTEVLPTHVNELRDICDEYGLVSCELLNYLTENETNCFQ